MTEKEAVMRVLMPILSALEYLHSEVRSLINATQHMDTCLSLAQAAPPDSAALHSLMCCVLVDPNDDVVAVRAIVMQGLVHGQIAPANVVFGSGKNREGQLTAKLANFDTSWEPRDGRKCPVPSACPLEYMPPEMVMTNPRTASGSLGPEDPLHGSMASCCYFDSKVRPSHRKEDSIAFIPPESTSPDGRWCS